MNKKLPLVFSLASFVLALDLFSKWLIVKWLVIGDEVSVISGFFDIVHVRNKGAAFGMLSGWDSHWREVVFCVVGLVALVLLYQYIKETAAENKKLLACFGLILGGALGNLIDRFWHGSVVDFLSFHIQNVVIDRVFLGYHLVLPLFWPAFNVADIALSVSVVCLILFSLVGSGKNKSTTL